MPVLFSLFRLPVPVVVVLLLTVVGVGVVSHLPPVSVEYRLVPLSSCCSYCLLLSRMIENANELSCRLLQ